jgi:hypothetical protein
MRTLVNRQDSRGQEFGEGSGPIDAASGERPPIFRAPDDSPQVVKRDGTSWVVVDRGPVVSKLREAVWVRGPRTHVATANLITGDGKRREVTVGQAGHQIKAGGRTLLVLTSELPERKGPYQPEVGINRARAADADTDAWLASHGERVGKRGQSKGILMNYKRGEE